MIKRKNFSNEFKEKIVLEYTSGQSSAAQIAQREGITSQTVRDWGKAFNNKKISEYEFNRIFTEKASSRIRKCVS
ncbi:MAG: transposase [Leptospiraceae bacterium]|nr:transposase [Leptospiraceae bacterium]